MAADHDGMADGIYRIDNDDGTRHGFDFIDDGRVVVVVRGSTKPGKGDTAKFYVPPRWGSIRIRLVRNKATFRLRSVPCFLRFPWLEKNPP